MANAACTCRFSGNLWKWKCSCWRRRSPVFGGRSHSGDLGTRVRGSMGRCITQSWPQLPLVILLSDSPLHLPLLRCTELAEDGQGASFPCAPAGYALNSPHGRSGHTGTGCLHAQSLGAPFTLWASFSFSAASSFIFCSIFACFWKRPSTSRSFAV